MAIFDSYKLVICLLLFVLNSSCSQVSNNHKDPDNTSSVKKSYATFETEATELYKIKDYSGLLSLYEEYRRNKKFDIASSLNICTLKERIGSADSIACYTNLYKQIDKSIYENLSQQHVDGNAVIVPAFAKVKGSQVIIDEYLKYHSHVYSDLLQPFDREKLIYTMYP